MRVLVDTSVWIEHLRAPQHELTNLLIGRTVLIHSAIIGELACGNLSKRKQFLADLQLLPRAVEATVEDSLLFLEQARLFGKGLGWIDIQLLVSAKLSNAEILTYDKSLKKYLL